MPTTFSFHHQYDSLGRRLCFRILPQVSTSVQKRISSETVERTKISGIKIPLSTYDILANLRLAGLFPDQFYDSMAHSRCRADRVKFTPVPSF
jgi:hypothetical protein